MNLLFPLSLRNGLISYSSFNRSWLLAQVWKRACTQSMLNECVKVCRLQQFLLLESGKHTLRFPISLSFGNITKNKTNALLCYKFLMLRLERELSCYITVPPKPFTEVVPFLGIITSRNWATSCEKWL